MAAEQSITAQLELHEGKRRKVYRCSAGYLTAGVGRNLDANGFSDDEIALMLANDIARAESLLDRDHTWWRRLSPVRQKVVLDMMFNLGPKGFAGFRNTILEIRAGDYDSAARRMLQSKWAKQVGTRARRLAEMMRTGRDYLD